MINLFPDHKQREGGQLIIYSVNIGPKLTHISYFLGGRLSRFFTLAQGNGSFTACRPTMLLAAPPHRPRRITELLARQPYPNAARNSGTAASTTPRQQKRNDAAHAVARCHNKMITNTTTVNTHLGQHSPTPSLKLWPTSAATRRELPARPRELLARF